MTSDSNDQRPLLLEIARCPRLLQQFEEPSLRQECSALINCQAPLSRETHQAPEPWSGDLQTSRILFFGSNPSINTAEQFPTLAWPDEDIEDFFSRRFGRGRRPWVDARLRVLLVDGTHGKRSSSVRFWAACRARATEILGRAARPGVDFAISEVVHCKSKGESENGRAITRLATPVCSERYTMRIIRASAAKVVCLMGDVPGAEFRRLLNAEKAVRFLGPLNVQAQERYFVFLDHPAGRGSVKTIAAALSAEQIALICEAAR